MYTRSLKPYKSKSYFLFGPRQAGKTSFMKSRLMPENLCIDLLPQQTCLGYLLNNRVWRDGVQECRKEQNADDENGRSDSVHVRISL